MGGRVVEEEDGEDGSMGWVFGGRSSRSGCLQDLGYCPRRDGEPEGSRGPPAAPPSAELLLSTQRSPSCR